MQGRAFLKKHCSPALSPRPPAESAAAAVASGGPAAAEAAPEPFAREAKHFTELRVLNKEVAIVLEGVSQVGGCRWLASTGEPACRSVCVGPAGRVRSSGRQQREVWCGVGRGEPPPGACLGAYLSLLPN